MINLIGFFILCITIFRLTQLGLACRHKWKVTEAINLTDDENDKIGTRYHLQCEKCGDMKKRDMK